MDALPEILRLRDRFGFRVHVDAAYGGYFTLADNLAPSHARGFRSRIGEADSIVIDPHKHGLQPYGCGCVLFRDPAVGALYQTRFALHLLLFERTAPGRDQSGVLPARRFSGGSVGHAAIATPGCRRRIRRRTFSLARGRYGLARRLSEVPRWVVPFAPELDIVVWAPRATSASEASVQSQQIFDRAAAGVFTSP